MNNNKSPAFAIGIPTRNRPFHLEATLIAISQLLDAPLEVYVCDSSSPNLQNDVNLVCSESNFKTTLLWSPRASVPFQRNYIAKAVLRSEIPFEFLLFLDDDTAPESSYVRILINFLKHNPNYGGASGITQYEKRSLILDFFGRIFMVNGRPGRVLLSGVGVPPSRNDNAGSDVDWIFGCSLWRTEVLKSFLWKDDWDGYAVGEDVEFSFRVSKKWKLRVLPQAKLIHAPATEGRPTSYNLARATVIHRLQIALLHRKSKFVTLLCVFWGTIGELGFSCFKMFVKPTRNQIKAIFGYLMGFISIVLNSKSKNF